MLIGVYVERRTSPTSTEQVEVDADALAAPTSTATGDAAAQALADALGCSRAEAYRRAAVLVARLLGVAP
jgi:hypothetical protein